MNVLKQTDNHNANRHDYVKGLHRSGAIFAAIVACAMAFSLVFFTMVASASENEDDPAASTPKTVATDANDNAAGDDSAASKQAAAASNNAKDGSGNASKDSAIPGEGGESSSAAAEVADDDDTSANSESASSASAAATNADDSSAEAADASDASASAEAADASSASAAAVDASSSSAAAKDPKASVKMPAVNFKEELTTANGMRLVVQVEAPKGAFPQGTTMKVKEVSNSTVEDAVDSAVAAKTKDKVTDMQAVDITFYNKDGKEIEPAKKITVKFVSDLIAQDDDTLVLHVDDNGKADVVKPLSDAELESRDKEAKDNELLIDSDEFSVYVLAATTAISTDVLTADGSTYKVTVNFDESAGIPEESQLNVTEYLPGTDKYKEYLDQAAQALDQPNTKTISFARFFDIEIRNATGERIEPSASVQVKIELADAPQIATSEPVIVHFEANGPVVMESETIGESDVCFETDSFSAYAYLMTGEEAPQADATDLDGWFVTLDRAGRYVTSTQNNGSNPNTLRKSNSQSAANWQFESAGSDGQYYISTMVNGQKQYLNMTPTAIFGWGYNDSAHTRLQATSNPQAFTVSQNTDGTYTVARTINGVTYDLMEWQGSSGPGFAGFDAGVLGSSEDSHLAITRQYRLAEDLDGWSFTLDREGRYVTATQNGPGNQTPRTLGKDSDSKNAAIWTFESAGSDGQYYISTTVNGQSQYLNLTPTSSFGWGYNDSAHTTIQSTDSPQAFTVYQNTDGTYTIARTANNITYYLMEWSGSTGPGFAGIDSGLLGNSSDYRLNVTYTAKDGKQLVEPGQDYAVIIKDEKTGKYYAVQEEGKLVEVEYDEETGVARVLIERPFAWSYTSAHDGIASDGASSESDPYFGNEPYNIRSINDARGYNQETQLAEGYYYKYLSPVADSGLETESNDNRNHNDAKWRNAIFYEDYKVHGVEWNGSGFVNTNKYIGADFDSLKLVGNVDASQAATIFFARYEDVPNWSSNNEAVSHIDIGIIGTATLEAPLAYGTYYDADGNPILTVTPDKDVTLNLVEDINITHDDIMKATLTAHKKDGTEIDDAFYISGYSANKNTQWSNDQVRMEGNFKVTTLDPYVPTTDCPRANDDEERTAARLENQVYYKVSVHNKEITFNLEYNGQQLYDSNGNELSITAETDVTADFSYWSNGDDKDPTVPRNECPPLQKGFEEKYGSYFGGQSTEAHQWFESDVSRGSNNRHWLQGAIVDNDWDFSQLSKGDYGDYPPYIGDTGMDFVLRVDIKLKDKILAVEVNKGIVDPDGNPVQPAEDVTNSFALYYNANGDPTSVANGYAVPPNEATDLASKQTGFQKLQDITMTVQGGEESDGKATNYDYKVEPGMYYVEEDEGSIQDVIIDTKGREWKYKETRIETEYVWRDDEWSTDDGSKKHVVEGYSGVPEVLGNYKDSKGADRRNGFLELFVYNVYEPQFTDVTITKAWDDEGDEAGKRIAAADFASYLTLKADGEVVKDYEPTVEVDEEDSSKYIVTWKDLPKYKDDKEIAYTVEESAIDGYETSGSPAENGGTITNTIVPPEPPETVGITITKAWDDEGDKAGKRVKATDFAAYLTLKANGEAVKGTKPTVTDNGNDTYTVTWKGLPKFKDDKEIKYTVEESAIDGYTTQGSPAENKGTITNKIVPPEPPVTTQVSVTKAWSDNDDEDGTRPTSVVIKLYADGTDAGKRDLELNAANGWKGSWTDLPKAKDGKDITYTVQEAAVEGYVASIAGDAASGFTVTNTRVEETVDVAVDKVWNDSNNKDGKRPSSVKVKLLANGRDADQEQLVLSKSNGWAGAWTVLPKYAAGKEIKYSVEEVNVPSGYTSSVSGSVKDGFTVTNTHRVKGAFPKSGDLLTIIPFAVLFITSSVVLAFAARKRRDSTKRG